MAGLTDERTISQIASILDERDARGRVAIESKEDARKRGVKSLDRPTQSCLRSLRWSGAGAVYRDPLPGVAAKCLKIQCRGGNRTRTAVAVTPRPSGRRLPG